MRDTKRLIVLHIVQITKACYSLSFQHLIMQLCGSTPLNSLPEALNSPPEALNSPPEALNSPCWYDARIHYSRDSPSADFLSTAHTKKTWTLPRILCPGGCEFTGTLGEMWPTGCEFTGMSGAFMFKTQSHTHSPSCNLHRIAILAHTLRVNWGGSQYSQIVLWSWIRRNFLDLSRKTNRN
jgi:hypothetical protein